MSLATSSFHFTRFMPNVRLMFLVHCNHIKENYLFVDLVAI